MWYMHDGASASYGTDFYMLCDSRGYIPTDEIALINRKNHGDDATCVILIYL
jgi:hypothetical protein